MKISREKYLSEVVPILVNDMFEDIEYSPSHKPWSDTSIVFLKVRGKAADDPETGDHWRVADIFLGQLVRGIYQTCRVIDASKYGQAPANTYEELKPELKISVDTNTPNLRVGVPIGTFRDFDGPMKELQQGLHVVRMSQSAEVMDF